MSTLAGFNKSQHDKIKDKLLVPPVVFDLEKCGFKPEDTKPVRQQKFLRAAFLHAEPSADDARVKEVLKRWEKVKTSAQDDIPDHFPLHCLGWAWEEDKNSRKFYPVTAVSTAINESSDSMDDDSIGSSSSSSNEDEPTVIYLRVSAENTMLFNSGQRLRKKNAVKTAASSLCQKKSEEISWEKVMDKPDLLITTERDGKEYKVPILSSTIIRKNNSDSMSAKTKLSMSPDENRYHQVPNCLTAGSGKETLLLRKLTGAKCTPLPYTGPKDNLNWAAPARTAEEYHTNLLAMKKAVAEYVPPKKDKKEKKKEKKEKKKEKKEKKKEEEAEEKKKKEEEEKKKKEEAEAEEKKKKEEAEKKNKEAEEKKKKKEAEEKKKKEAEKKKKEEEEKKKKKEAEEKKKKEAEEKKKKEEEEEKKKKEAEEMKEAEKKKKKKSGKRARDESPLSNVETAKKVKFDPGVVREIPFVLRTSGAAYDYVMTKEPMRWFTPVLRNQGVNLDVLFVNLNNFQEGDVNGLVKLLLEHFQTRENMLYFTSILLYLFVIPRESDPDKASLVIPPPDRMIKTEPMPDTPETNLVKKVLRTMWSDPEAIQEFMAAYGELRIAKWTMEDAENMEKTHGILFSSLLISLMYIASK